MDEEQELFHMNLVALFASCLDEVEAIARQNMSTNTSWKKKAIRLCCDSTSDRVLKFLDPWLTTNTKLAPEPLVQWFRKREHDSVERRRRANGIRSLVEIVIKAGTYDARVRAALKQVARYLAVSWKNEVAPFENFLAQQLLAASLKDSQATPRSSWSDWSATRIAKVTAAAAVGGTAIALTAGAAAPILAPVVGAIFATQATASIALSIGLFGAAGAGLTGYKMADRTERGLKEFFFEQVARLSSDKASTSVSSLNLVIGVPGSMDSEDVEPLKEFWSRSFSYETASSSAHGWSDVYVLLFDRKILLQYSKTVAELLKDQIVSHAYSFFLKQVIGHAVMAAIALPMQVNNAFNVINNSFVVCEGRAQGAGMELAAALRHGYQGARPVTLVGFGFGALAIFHALESLERERSFGIVEDVILIGTPLRAVSDRWTRARSVVAGKFVNAYCENDWTLKLAMQWSASSSAIAGVEPLEVEGIVDFPISVNHYQIGKDGGIEMSNLLRSVLDE